MATFIYTLQERVNHACYVGSNPDGIKLKTMELVFDASPLSKQNLGVRSNTDWFGIATVYPTGRTYLVEDCCYTDQMLSAGLVQCGNYYYHSIELWFARAMI